MASKPAPSAAAGAPAGMVYDIPTVSFRIITDDKSLLVPAGVHSVGGARGMLLTIQEQARSYGCELQVIERD
jgi:hypothetical protein